jgi:hypothetical protein
MAKHVQLIGYTSAALAGVTGAQRELFIDTTNWTIAVNDGITPGGHSLARADMANVAAATDSTNGIMLGTDKAKLDLYPAYPAAPFALNAGTAALPAYSFAGDLDLGIWSPAADQLAFSMNGAEKARFDNTGRLLIGLTADGGGGQLLQVNGAVNATDVQIGGVSVGIPGLQWISSQTAANVANLIFALSGTYTHYTLMFDDVNAAALPANGCQIELLVSNDGGVTYKNSAYQWTGHAAANTVTLGGNTADTKLVIAGNGAFGQAIAECMGQIDIGNPHDTTKLCMFQGFSVVPAYGTGVPVIFSNAGFWNGTGAAITHIKVQIENLSPAVVNILTGNFHLYGGKN